MAENSSGQEEPRKLPSKIKKKLISDSTPFEKLVEWECDPNILLTVLQLIGKPIIISDDWSKMMGMPKKRILTIINRLVRCAKDIEHLNAQRFTYVLRHYGDRPQIFDRLPDLLRKYANELMVDIKLIGPKKHIARDKAKSLLVAYVKLTTGKFHDKEVAHLIAGELHNYTYTALNHRMWRGKYYRPALSKDDLLGLTESDSRPPDMEADVVIHFPRQWPSTRSKPRLLPAMSHLCPARVTHAKVKAKISSEVETRHHPRRRPEPLSKNGPLVLTESDLGRSKDTAPLTCRDLTQAKPRIMNPDSQVRSSALKNTVQVGGTLEKRSEMLANARR